MNRNCRTNGSYVSKKSITLMEFFCRKSPREFCNAQIKKKIKIFLKYYKYIGNSEGSGAKSYITNDLLIYGENICAFPHILGSLSSYMTLHPIPLISLYMRKIMFSFLSVWSYRSPMGLRNLVGPVDILRDAWG
jgi:hypothetical protein